MLTGPQQAEFDDLIETARHRPLRGRQLGRMRELALLDEPLEDGVPWVKIAITGVAIVGLFLLARRWRRQQRAAIALEAVDVSGH